MRFIDSIAKTEECMNKQIRNKINKKYGYKSTYEIKNIITDNDGYGEILELEINVSSEDYINHLKSKMNNKK